MKIKFITPELHAELLGIQQEHPELTFQNNVYEYLPPAVRESKAEQIKRIAIP